MIFGISFGKKKTSQQSSTDTNIKENTNQGQSQSTTGRSEEHTSELQSLMRISYAVFCFKYKIFLLFIFFFFFFFLFFFLFFLFLSFFSLFSFFLHLLSF